MPQEEKVPKRNWLLWLFTFIAAFFRRVWRAWIKFLRGIEWVKRVSEKIKFWPVAFCVVVLWSIPRLLESAFLFTPPAAFVLAFMVLCAITAEFVQSGSSSFSFSKFRIDMVFAALTLIWGTVVLTLVMRHNGPWRFGLHGGDVFVVLLCLFDILVSPYNSIRVASRTLMGMGHGLGGDQDVVSQDVQVHTDGVDQVGHE